MWVVVFRHIILIEKKIDSIYEFKQNPISLKAIYLKAKDVNYLLNFSPNWNYDKNHLKSTSLGKGGKVETGFSQRRMSLSQKFLYLYFCNSVFLLCISSGSDKITKRNTKSGYKSLSLSLRQLHCHLETRCASKCENGNINCSKNCNFWPFFSLLI